jgi:hypothetical protein
MRAIEEQAVGRMNPAPSATLVSTYYEPKSPSSSEETLMGLSKVDTLLEPLQLN